MQVFLANSNIQNIGHGAKGVWSLFEEYQPYALISYHYFKKYKFETGLKKEFPLRLPRLFCDSGGFSALTQNVEINVQDYGNWLKTNLEYFYVYANLDVIGNEIKTAENQKILEEEFGLSPIPVYHVGTPFKILENLMEKYDYIALGGLVPHSTNKKALLPYFVKCFEMAEQVKDRKIKFHGFGMTNWKILKMFPFYSVDSSSWNKGAMFGQLSLFDSERGEFIPIKLWNKGSVYKHARQLRAIGFNPEWFVHKDQYKRDYACALDGIAWAKASLWLCKYWKQDYTIYFAQGAALHDISKLLLFIDDFYKEYKK